MSTRYLLCTCQATFSISLGADSFFKGWIAEGTIGHPRTVSSLSQKFSDSHPTTLGWISMKWYEYIGLPARNDFIFFFKSEYQCFDGEYSVFGSYWWRQCSRMKVYIKRESCHFVEYVMVNRVSASCRRTFFCEYIISRTPGQRNSAWHLAWCLFQRHLNILQDSMHNPRSPIILPFIYTSCATAPPLISATSSLATQISTGRQRLSF